MQENKELIFCGVAELQHKDLGFLWNRKALNPFPVHN
jgi:hypothetical protein